MAWVQPIYDRTSNDVSRVIYLNESLINNTITPEELAEWRTPLKGAINKEDIVRMHNNESWLLNYITKGTSKNLYDSGQELGYYSGSSFTRSNYRLTTSYIEIEPNTNYAISIDVHNTMNMALYDYAYFNASKQYLGNRSTNSDSSFAGSKTHIFNIKNTNAKYIRVTCRGYSSSYKNLSNISLIDSEFQLEVGSQVTAYEPHKEVQYPDITVNDIDTFDGDRLNERLTRLTEIMSRIGIYLELPQKPLNNYSKINMLELCHLQLFNILKGIEDDRDYAGNELYANFNELI